MSGWKNKRQYSERLGRWAETWVSIYFWLRFYRRLHHRYRNPFGEIDLIFSRGTRLIFIEVKFRSSADQKDQSFDHIERNMPHPAQRKRLIRAAYYYLETHPALTAKICQFDLAIVYPSGKIKIITNGIDTWVK